MSNNNGSSISATYATNWSNVSELERATKKLIDWYSAKVHIRQIPNDAVIIRMISDSIKDCGEKEKQVEYITAWYFGRMTVHQLCTQLDIMLIVFCQLVSWTVGRHLHQGLVRKLATHVGYVRPLLTHSFDFERDVEPQIHRKSDASFHLTNVSTDNAHRAGWVYALSGLERLNKPLSPLVFDACIDQTFLWGRDVFRSMGIIPYNGPWTGVIHHTFSQACAPNNCVRLFQQAEFIDSLVHCKGLFVLSEHLASQVRDKMKELKIYNIHVHTVFHPTELDNLPKFDIISYMDTPKKQIVQIGRFLRNFNAFEKLRVPQGFEKCVLRPIEVTQTNDEMSALNALNESNALNTLSERNDLNALSALSGSNEKYSDDIEGIKSISYLENNDFDILLTKSIVFLNLHDASACNTLIECMARGTPILINRIPPVVEYIGEDYPGLYETLADAEQLLSNPQTIIEMHEYLQNKNLEFLKLDSFVNAVNNIVKTFE